MDKLSQTLRSRASLLFAMAAPAEKRVRVRASSPRPRAISPRPRASSPRPRATSSGTVEQVNRFTNPTLYEWFTWRSQCPITFKAAVACFRVVLKTLDPRAQVDGEQVLFNESEVVFHWKRPATVKAAHAWAFRTLKSLNFKGG